MSRFVGRITIFLTTAVGLASPTPVGAAAARVDILSPSLAAATVALEAALPATGWPNAGTPPEASDASAGALVPLDAATLKRVEQRGPGALLVDRLSALEQRLFHDAADGELNDHTLIEAALIAGGVAAPDELRRWRAVWSDRLEQFRDSCDAARNAVSPPTPGMHDVVATSTALAIGEPPSNGCPPSKSELLSTDEFTDSEQRVAVALFDFMHEEILGGGYQLESTDVREALGAGRYNCVSASVLYQSLGGALGLRLVALEMPGHVLSRLKLAERSVDVETTCPAWFRLSDRPRLREEAVRARLGSARPGDERDRAEAREVGPVELLAMIYYNQGVALLADGRFGEATLANAKALRLDPDNQIARGNLLATLNNWSIALGQREQFPEAVIVLEAGLSVDPRYPTFGRNYVHVHHQWIQRLMAQGRYDEALRRLRRAAANMPDRPYLRQAEAEVRRRALQAAECSP